MDSDRSAGDTGLASDNQGWRSPVVLSFTSFQAPWSSSPCAACVVRSALDVRVDSSRSPGSVGKLLATPAWRERIQHAEPTQRDAVHKVFTRAEERKEEKTTDSAGRVSKKTTSGWEEATRSWGRA